MDIEKAKSVLIEIKEILDKNRIPFFLLHGTALGAIRDNGIIPYDKDIDLGVLHEDFAGNIERVEKDFVKSGFRAVVKSWPFSYSRAIVVFKDGIKTDISGFMKKRDERYSYSTRKDYAHVYAADMIEKTISVKMYDYEWKSVGEDFLYFNYGTGWKIKNPDWNVKSSPAVKRCYIDISAFGGKK